MLPEIEKVVGVKQRMEAIASALKAKQTDLQLQQNT
jgi:hypothetical protein